MIQEFETKEWKNLYRKMNFDEKYKCYYIQLKYCCGMNSNTIYMGISQYEKLKVELKEFQKELSIKYGI